MMGRAHQPDRCARPISTFSILHSTFTRRWPMSDRKANLRAGLERDRQFLLDAVSALSEEDLTRSCGHESDWTVKDLIGHIAYAEGGMIPLIQGGAAGE